MSCFAPYSVSAMEMHWRAVTDFRTGLYYAAPVMLTWDNVTLQNKLYMNISSTKYISNTTLRSIISSQQYAWDNTGLTTTEFTTSTSGVNVYMVIPTDTYFDNITGNTNPSAHTILFDTSGNLINYVYEAQQSTKYIRSAQIFFNPTTTYVNNADFKKLVAHEMGHALTQGHPMNWGCDQYYGDMWHTIKTGVNSVMHQGSPSLAHVSNLPAVYDRIELENDY